MSRAFDFIVVVVIWIIAAVIHMMGVTLFAPGTGLHSIASTGTAAMSGADRADLWYEILAVWVPLAAGIGIAAWAIVREYRRQAFTAVAPRP